LYVKKKITQYIVVHSYGIIGRIIEANAISHIVKSIKIKKGRAISDPGMLGVSLYPLSVFEHLQLIVLEIY